MKNLRYVITVLALINVAIVSQAAASSTAKFSNSNAVPVVTGTYTTLGNTGVGLE